MKDDSRFRHESLQDADTIRDLLKALTNGIGRGEVTLEDENGSLTMHPEGLLHLRIAASIDDERNRLDIRIRCQGEHDIPERAKIGIKSGRS